MSERIRCAIYTRKSTEDGLEQDFNSLDAQREACEAYVRSQKGMGWTILPKRYDDGGISGGTMGRPALQELLADIERGKVDLVVVYKVDRLTRALTDFAKIIETFDERNVSFVSVTQQFNTANSMGRLTLNVLLSFAQFEREVTAERIRDKIAASKKKGIWMGGLAPLGYDAKEKRLVINEAEAETVRELFRLYLARGSIRELRRTTIKQGIVTKIRVINGEEKGGKPFTRGHLHQLLRNPVYIGKITHRDQEYDGLHEPILDEESWDAVQQMLAGKAPERRSPTNGRSCSLLAGLLRDETGDRLTPSHARKGERAYRYYISRRLMAGNEDEDEGRGWRLPQAELDRAVTTALKSFVETESEWMGAVDLADLPPTAFEQVRSRIKQLGEQLKGSHQTKRNILCDLVEQITVAPGSLTIRIRKHTLQPDQPVIPSNRFQDVEIPFHTRRRGVEAKIVIGNEPSGLSQPDMHLIGVITRSHDWWQRMTTGEDWTVDRLAKDAGINACEVTRYLPLVFLAPDIIEAIIEGRQPVELNIEKLKKLGPIPMDWDAQRQLLGFAG